MEKKIIESNRLIAEFMGYENQCEDWCGSNILEMDDLFGEPFMRPFNPDKRWDDLMPVIQKINGWNIKDNPEIIIDNSVTTYLKVRKPLYKALHSINLPETYNAVVQILEWHSTLFPHTRSINT